jgi:hypothetical protein
MRILAALAAFFLVACEEPTGPSEAAPVSAAEEMESVLDLPDGGMIGLSPELASRFARRRRRGLLECSHGPDGAARRPGQRGLRGG